MQTLSFWEKETFFTNLDVAVIGSGIVGLSAAICLKEKSPNLKVAVIERGTLPAGASTRNAGFACFGSMTELLEDLDSQSEEQVFALVERRWKGLQRLRQRVGDQNLAFQSFGGYEIFTEGQESAFLECAENLEYLNKQLSSIINDEAVFSLADKLISKFGFSGVKHIISNKAESQLHPGKMMKALLGITHSLGVQVFNGLTIKKLEEEIGHVILKTEEGWEFSAKKVLVATNGFAKSLLPSLELVPGRNQVLITKPIENLPFKGAFHYDRGFYYFRNVDDEKHPNASRILLGGGRNLALSEEQTDQFGHTELIQNALLQLLQETILPERKIEVETWWSGILGLGNQKRPIVQMVSDRIGTAVRLGGMGVAIGSLVGEEAAHLMMENL